MLIICFDCWQWFYRWNNYMFFKNNNFGSISLLMVCQVVNPLQNKYQRVNYLVESRWAWIFIIIVSNYLENVTLIWSIIEPCVVCLIPNTNSSKYQYTLWHFNSFSLSEPLQICLNVQKKILWALLQFWCNLVALERIRLAKSLKRYIFDRDKWEAWYWLCRSRNNTFQQIPS